VSTGYVVLRTPLVVCFGSLGGVREVCGAVEMAAVWCKLMIWLCVVMKICNSSGVTAVPVMSVDLGSEWLKVAVVNLKPGQPPISIAPNEMSKRKSPALVAFSRGDRLVSEEASGILARYPERVLASLRDMVGKPYGAVQELLKSQHLPCDVVEDASGRARIRVGENSGYGLRGA
jgi:hypoxia up-regulated 1